MNSKMSEHTQHINIIITKNAPLNTDQLGTRRIIIPANYIRYKKIQSMLANRNTNRVAIIPVRLNLTSIYSKIIFVSKLRSFNLFRMKV